MGAPGVMDAKEASEFPRYLRAVEPSVRIGTAGWSYPDWEGKVYPRPHPRGFHPLAYLARYVDAVELNASFYRIPRPEHAERWVDLVADRPDFRFVAKLHQTFTHDPWTTLPAAQARAFTAALAPLRAAGRLGALLAQYPVSFRATEANWRRVAETAAAFRDVPLVVEVRHRSFFEAEALARLADLGVAVAWIDLPPARDHPPAGHDTPGPIGYARLHGRNAGAWFRKGAGRDQRYDWLYGEDDLDRIAERVRELAAGGRQTYLITNNHYGGKAVANALELKGRFEGRPPLAPEPLRDAFPHLRGSTRAEGQQRLF